MEIDLRDFTPFYEWFGDAFLFFLWSLLILPPVGLVIAYIVAATRYGPIEGIIAVARSIGTAFGNDFPNFSFRRTFAIAYLSIKEAIRRKVLIVFAIFAVIFLFAGLFLDVESEHPARLYLSFVLTTSTFLVLFLALFLSVFSIPTDIAQRTIYTVVTKPVRASEIVLGRMLGFTIVCTGILVVMALVSFVFVARGMRHAHRVDGALDAVSTDDGKTEWVGKTTMDQHHRHDFRIGSDNQGKADLTHQHWHDMQMASDVDVEISSPQGELVARVPKFAKTLEFLDREGNKTQVGINVGYVWEYRSYIEGGSKQAAIWTFDGIDERDFPDDQITLALNLSVFRTYMGDINVPVRGVLYVHHPDPTKNLIAEPIPFVSQEFQEQLIYLPKKIQRYRVTGEASEELDLFRDLVQDGKLVIKLQCDDNQQYFGVAAADVYIRLPDSSFAANFLKGFLVIWLQMVSIISISVMYSTVLKSPVALVATAVSFLLGYFQEFVRELAAGPQYGGGPVEAFVRIITQENVVNPLDGWPWVIFLIQWTDKILGQVIYLFAAMLPTFKNISRMTEFVAYNYDIPGALLGRFAVTTLVYTLVFGLLGYFLLKSRELAG